MSDDKLFWASVGTCVVVVLATLPSSQSHGVSPSAAVLQRAPDVHPVIYSPPSRAEQIQPTGYVVPTATWSGSDAMCKAYYTQIAQLRPLMGNDAASDRMIRSQMASAQAYIDLNCR